MYITAGTYTGNATDNTNIAHGMSVTPDFVLVKRLDSTNFGRFKSPLWPSGATSKRINSTTANDTGIKSIDGTNFVLGADATSDVNGNTFSYGFFAIGDSGDADYELGSYSGDGTGAKTVTVSSFTDIACVWVLTSNLNIEQWRMNGGTTSHRFINAGDDDITAINSGSFDVGTALNASGTTFYWIAFKNVSGYIGTISYTGNGSDNRDITLSGVSATPTLVLIGNTLAATRYRLFRVEGIHSGDSSISMSSANLANYIQGQSAGTVQVGSSCNQNTESFEGLYIVQGAQGGGGGSTYQKIIGALRQVS